MKPAQPEVFRFKLHGVDHSLNTDQLRMKFTELGGIACRATEAALKAQVEFGSLLLQVRPTLLGRYEQWLRSMGIGKNFAFKCTNLAAEYADAHGHFDRESVIRAIVRYNEVEGPLGGRLLALEATPRNAEITLGLGSRRVNAQNVSHGKRFEGTPQDSKPLVPTGTREYDELDDVLGFAPAHAAGDRRATQHSQSNTTLGVSARAPGGGTFNTRAVTPREEADRLIESDRVRWAGAASNLSKATSGGMSDSRSTAPGGSGASAPSTTPTQLSLEGEYRAAAMARELAGLIESRQAPAGIVAEFVAWAEKVGLGLKGGA